MEAINCPRCGKVFVKISDPICPECVKEEEKIFDRVREYIRDNPNRTVKEVSDECDISVKRILGYIREGRINATSGMRDEIVCSKCRKPILTGRMCEKCILETNFEVNEMKKDFKNMGQYHVNRK